ncbi:MAG: SCO family protein [Gemmobacter sp.]
MTKLYAGSAAAAVIALVAATAWFVFMRAPDDPFAQCRGSTVAGGVAEIGGPFTLVDHTGATVTDRDVITRPTLVYFGYTFCPDVCPLDVARNAEAVDILDEMGYETVPVFISVDPARDTPEVLEGYAGLMHPRMIGLTGTPDQIRAAANAYKAYYNAQTGDDDYYLVDHTTFTYLVFPETGFAEFFRRDETSDQIAERVACFIDAS